MSPTHFGDMIFAPRDLSIGLADGLVQRGHEVYFFTAPDVVTTARLIGGDKELLDRDYVRAMLGGTKSERLEWGYTSVLKHTFEMDLTMRCYQMAVKEGFDIIHSYHERMAHFFDEMTDIPTVYTLHDPIPDSELNLAYWLLQKFSHHKYISISNAFRLHPTLHLNFVDTVYHGTPSVENVVNSKSRSYLAFMGRPIREKGIVDAIETAKHVHMPLKIASSRARESINDDAYFTTSIA
ncbi:MAG: glycosyltransferase, partial [bacterium]|nr:glycosyltransferase [bacterium]